jgi:hypothetical protein
MNDLEAAVVEMVSALPMTPMPGLDPTWRERWEASPSAR